MSEFTTLAEENFTTCDSPSGSSTSEPHEDILETFSPFFQKNDLLDSTFMLNNQSPISQNTIFSPEFTDSLLSNNSPMIEPNFWPDYNNVIPELTKNFTNQMNQYQESTPTSTPGMQIRVLGVPQTGAKSRVETQIKLCIQLVTDDGDKAQRWSHLKLPGDMVAKEKLKRPVIVSNSSTAIASLENTTLQQENILCLTAKVICASDPDRKVTICSGCIQRERKRSQRRKDKRTDINEFGLEEESTEQKVLLFNCSEVVDFSSGDAILPTRITCYCRHHNERLGFCIYFEMSDCLGQKVASGISPPIMITDDHKSNKAKPNRKRPRTDSEVPRLTSLNPKQSSHHQIQPRPSNSTEAPLFSSERPLLQRLIPNEGPTFGGIEVTVLGSNFRAGLTCMFGDVAASSTHFWSPNTLVCVLPPAATPGTVVVSFKEYPMVMEEVNLFTYYNENDRALMELALQVVGLKMTGKVEDAREIAMRIVQGGDASSNSPSSANLESHVMRVLDVMTTLCSVNREDVSITSTTGHSMLHLAAMLGFSLLTKKLVCLGCDGDIMDRNGYTALHYAAWYGHTEVVHLLLEDANVDREITNRWDKKPLELAENAAIKQAILNTSEHDRADLSSNESIWLGDIEDSDILEEVFSDSDLSVSSDESDTHPVIQYLNKTDIVSYTHEGIIDAQPFEDVDLPAEDEKEAPKDMTWMQRTLSHFQPTTTSHDFLQNIKNTIPAKPTELNFKNIADHVLQFPSRPASMVSGLFSTKTNNQEEPPAETLAWYMALAYAMGAKGFLSEDEKEEQMGCTKPEECTVSKKKERDRMLYSFWVPMLCVMIVWLIFQIVSSNPSVTDTIISLSGIRKQYLTVH